MEYKEQLNLFDDEATLEAAIQNLTALKEKASAGNLSEVEKKFITGLASMADRTEPAIQPEKLVGKKINPFSRMMMSAAETVTKAKKSFSIWKKQEPEMERIEPTIDTPFVSLKEKMMAQFTSKITSSVEDLNSTVSNLSEGAKIGKQKVSKTVNNVTEQVAGKVDGFSNMINQKGLSLNEKFFEIYDNVTLARLNAQAKVQDKIENAKDVAVKFVEVFEEPWIKIKGQEKIPSLADISYNAGLYAGKARQKIADTLDGFVASLTKKQNPPNVFEDVFMEQTVPVNNNKDTASVNNPIEPQSSGSKLDTSETASIIPEVKKPENTEGGNGTVTFKISPDIQFNSSNIGNPTMIVSKLEEVPKPIQSVAAVENVTAETPAASSGVIIGSKLGALPSDLDEKVAAAIAARNEKELQKKEYLDKGILSMPENQKVVNEKDKSNTVKKTSFLSKIRNLFVKEDELKNSFEFNQDEQKIDLPQFRRNQNGALPSMSEIFKGTEASLEKNIGLSVYKNGGYYFPELEKDGVTNNDRFIKIRDDIIPKYLDELKDAAAYLYQVNEKNKNDPTIKTFKVLSGVLGGDKEAKNYIERSKTSDKDRQFLEKLGVPGMGTLLSDIDQSLFKIKDNEFHLKAAKFNLAVLTKAGDSIRTELLFLRGTVPEYKEVIDKMNNTKLFKDMTVNRVCENVSNSTFDETLNQLGNEGVVLRMNALQLKNQEDFKKKKNDNAIKSEKIDNRELVVSSVQQQRTPATPSQDPVSNSGSLVHNYQQASINKSYEMAKAQAIFQPLHGDLNRMTSSGMTIGQLEQLRMMNNSMGHNYVYTPPPVDMSQIQHLALPVEAPIKEPAVGVPPIPPNKGESAAAPISITKPSKELITELEQTEQLITVPPRKIKLL